MMTTFLYVRQNMSGRMIQSKGVSFEGHFLGFLGRGIAALYLEEIREYLSGWSL
ncbi:hypothetical protein [Leptothermofonsia sp. ETS-13]|uniref:hypothetical protein n=1 Tax=Leptothermofonsia sp. ETS-13 TaxID=3035696 RepID=UPI003B9DF2F8